jgi:hypothetical protein
MATIYTKPSKLKYTAEKLLKDKLEEGIIYHEA